jgi:multiple sugar transport system permease protein
VRQPAWQWAQAGFMRRRKWSRYSIGTFYVFIAPWLLVGLLALTLLPLAYALGLSFTDFDGFSGHWHWIGWSNYVEAVQDSDTWNSLWRTILLALITVPLGVVLGLGLAILLNRKMRGISIFRTIFYIPAIVPVVASALMWKAIFDRDTGIVNGIIERLGGNIVLWLEDPTAFYVLIVMILWGVGTGMIIYLAGLQGVPAELREAAAMDGAGPVQAFCAVDLPLLTPVIFFQVVMGIIAALQRLVEPFLLASGGSGSTGSTAMANPALVPQSNQLFMVNVYTQVFYNDRFGYGSALLWILFLVVLVLTLIVFRTSSLWVYYEVDQEGTEK